MRPAFCAICTDESTSLVARALGRNDAIVWVCQECDSTKPVARCSDRGYESPGERLNDGRGLLQAFADAANRITGKVDRGQASLAASVTPGFKLVRVRRFHAGKPVDSKEARAKFSAEPWFAELRHLGSDKRFHLFERPDVDAVKRAREQTEYDPIAALAAASN